MGCCSSNLVNYSNKINPASSSDHWDYNNTDNWISHYPCAGGKNQSPIDIITSLAVYDESLNNRPFVFIFDLNCFTEIRNNGHTFVISAEADNSSVTGGLIPNSYRFAQFHMHWGIDESHGSEHIVDGSSFAAELHFVYWNNTNYVSFESAAQSNKHDGLLVFAVFVIIGAENNEFNKITTVIDKVKLAHQSTFVSKPLEIIKFFPENLNKYWSYLGSLTTPPCTECALWTVFCDPIQISLKQIKTIKHLYKCNDIHQCADSKRIKKNHRLTCDLNGRKILKSFN